MNTYPEERRTYIEVSGKGGWPVAPNLHYECLRCGDILPSLPRDNLQCSCHNIEIDVDYGRFGARHPNLMRAFLFG